MYHENSSVETKVHVDGEIEVFEIMKEMCSLFTCLSIFIVQIQLLNKLSKFSA